MIISQIIAAPTPKHAVSYDPEAKCLVYEKAEIIALAHLVNPDNHEETATMPTYMVHNKYGFFVIPELEFNFLAYVNIEQTLSMTSGWVKKRIKEIEADYKQVGEMVEVETKGNLAKIRRINFIKKDENDKS